jgi:phosphatidylinositol glycan class M
MHLWNWKQILRFGILSGGVCLGLIGVFYLQDGFKFIYEAYLYHFFRKDHRHNFSLFYYAIYLASESDNVLLSRILTFAGFIPQLGSLLFVGVRYGRRNFMFSIFLQTIIFVAFNKVITAQYFLWYFGLLPVALHAVIDSHPDPPRVIAFVVGSIFLWAISEVYWLRESYKLEVLGEHNFKQLLTASVTLFIAQIIILVVFIRAFEGSRAHVKKIFSHPQEIRPESKVTREVVPTRARVGKTSGTRKRSTSRASKVVSRSNEEVPTTRRSARLRS